MSVLIDEYRNILALIAIELVLVAPCMERRSRYFLRLIGGIALSIAFASLHIFLHKLILSIPTGSILTVILSVVWYVAVVLWTGGLMAFCHKMNKTELIWVLITAYAAQHFIYAVIIELIFFGIVGSSEYLWLQLLAYAAFAAAVYLIMYLLFTPNLKRRRHLYVQDSWRNCAVLVVFLVIFLASTFINQANAWGGYEGVNYLSIASDIINCVFVVAVQYVSLRNARLRNEKDLVIAQLNGEKKQYNTFKNAVDYINVKVHDLKHEIAAMQREGAVNPARVDEISRNIAVYESFVHTGNETLDYVLTDKNLECAKHGISFSCMADAAGLSDMDEEDVYILFGNMLDNAVEYLKTVDESEKRAIRLYIRRQGNLIIIHQENYFGGALLYSEGLPRTTKGDSENHGFGTRSIRMIAEKYGGEMRISADDNLFRLDIVIVGSAE